jgi:RNA polymerase sigma-70 factor (ECF subfamily)
MRHTNQIDDASPTDVELMLKVKDGDEDGFVILVRRHQNYLLQFFRSMGLTADADDAVQETFLRLYRYRHRYEPKAGLRTFIHLLARQVCLDAFRKRQRRERHLDAYRQEAERTEAPSLPRPAGEWPEEAENLLRKLPEAMRAVVVMNIYQGMPYDEIAQALGIPVGTVKSRMFHAMLKMREALNVRKDSR